MQHQNINHIRSYVRRQGRITDAQQRYLTKMWPQIGLEYQQQIIEPSAIYGRQAPVILEIGCGMGNSTADTAIAKPENNYLCVEVYKPGLGNLCKLIAEWEIGNIRLIEYDAVEVVRHMLPAASLTGVHIFFPDPWPKKRHHKRRLIQPPFVSLLASRLQVGGYMHLTTDWQDYAEQMLAVLSAEPQLSNCFGDFAPHSLGRPSTRFEERGRRLGHVSRDIYFRCQRQGNTAWSAALTHSSQH